jgi:hypothetical protein
VARAFYARLTGGFAALLLSASTAHADVSDVSLLGDQANLMGGAVAASTRGGPSMWYNPARLMLAEEAQSSVAVSGAGFTLRRYNVPSLIQGGTDSTPLKTGEFLALPRAVTFVGTVRSDLRYGLGLLNPTRQDLALQTSQDGAADGEETFDSVAMRSRRTSHHVVAALSWALRSGWQLGATLHFVAYTFFSMAQVSSARNDVASGQALALFTSAEQLHNVGYGVRATLGVSYPAGRWLFGVSMSSPTLLFFARVRETQTLSSGTQAGAQLEFEPSARNDRGRLAQMPEPALLRAAIAYSGSTVLIEVDAEGASRAESETFGVDNRGTGNVRSGMLIGMKRKVRLGVGFFTDVERARDVITELGDTRLRGLGGTAGLNFVTRPPGKDVAEGGRQGAFSLTVATRYAHYVGDIAGVYVGESGNAETIEVRATPATAHEFALHLGVNGIW